LQYPLEALPSGKADLWVEGKRSIRFAKLLSNFGNFPVESIRSGIHSKMLTLIA